MKKLICIMSIILIISIISITLIGGSLKKGFRRPGAATIKIVWYIIWANYLKI